MEMNLHLKHIWGKQIEREKKRKERGGYHEKELFFDPLRSLVVSIIGIIGYNYYKYTSVKTHVK